jgi:hypothetical protein
MPQPSKYQITSHCSIRQNQVFRNGGLFYEDASALTLKDFQEGLYNHLEISYPKFYKMDPLSKLGLLGTEVLLLDVPSVKDYQPGEVGVVLSNAHSSLDTDIRYMNSVQEMASPALFVYTLPNIMIGEICIRHKFKGENSFFVFKEFDATFITGYVKGLLDEDLVKACVYGWVDVLNQDYDAELYLIEQNHQ